MASPSNTLTRPPQLDDPSSSTPPQTPTAPAAASPAPPQSNPTLDSATRDFIQAVNLLRGLAKSFPTAAPSITKANDAIREAMAAVMQHQTPGEPSAPPIAG